MDVEALNFMAKEAPIMVGLVTIAFFIVDRFKKKDTLSNTVELKRLENEKESNNVLKSLEQNIHNFDTKLTSKLDNVLERTEINQGAIKALDNKVHQIETVTVPTLNEKISNHDIRIATLETKNEK